MEISSNNGTTESDISSVLTLLSALAVNGLLHLLKDSLFAAVACPKDRLKKHGLNGNVFHT